MDAAVDQGVTTARGESPGGGIRFEVATVADDAAYVADQAKVAASTSAAPAASVAAAPAANEFKYFPSQFPAPTGPVEDLPPEF